MFALRATPAEVFRLDIDNVIHPVTVEMVADAVDQTRARGSTLLLIRLNTPGGLMEASREVVEKLIASPAPVVTWVAPSGAHAASAGFFVLLSGDVSAMAPGTHTGAASPVVLGRELDPILRRKVESDAGAWLRSIASRRGRNAALAEKAVSEAKSFTEQEALDSNLINLIAKDETELLSRLDGTVITRFNGTKQTPCAQGRKGCRLPTQPPSEDTQSCQRSQHRVGRPASRSARAVCRILYARSDISRSCRSNSPSARA